MTWAKPAYRAKYLMDNVEVFREWQSAAWMAQTMNRKTEAESSRKMVGRTLQVIGSLLFLEGKG